MYSLSSLMSYWYLKGWFWQIFISYFLRIIIATVRLLKVKKWKDFAFKDIIIIIGKENELEVEKLCLREYELELNWFNWLMYAFDFSFQYIVRIKEII